MKRRMKDRSVAGDDGLEDSARNDEDRTGDTEHTLQLTFLSERKNGRNGNPVRPA